MLRADQGPADQRAVSGWEVGVKIRVQILVSHEHGSRLDYVTPDEWLEVPDGMTPERAAIHALTRASELLARRIIEQSGGPANRD